MCGVPGTSDSGVLGCFSDSCAVSSGCVMFLVPVTAVSHGHVCGVPDTSDSDVLGSVCAVFLVLVAMVKLLSLDQLPGWSGDGCIPLSPCPLQASHLGCVSCRAVGTQGIRYWCCSAISPTLQSHVLLQTHQAALPGEPGKGLPVLRLESSELGRVEDV